MNLPMAYSPEKNEMKRSLSWWREGISEVRIKEAENEIIAYGDRAFFEHVTEAGD